MRLKVLHVVKTSDGARWAAQQAGVLAKYDVDIHVVVPEKYGQAMALWQEAGSTIHVADFSLPVRQPYALPQRIRHVRELVATIQPDVIHSHFVTTTMMLRLALGRHHPALRLFQVPGPLHLEHTLSRWAEIALAGENDFWIASSRYTYDLYRDAGVPVQKMFLSYYGFDVHKLASNSKPKLHLKYKLSAEAKLVGNINYMYPPKYYLGQTTGLKRHEDVIDALALVCEKRPEVTGILVGGQWGQGKRYEMRLRHRAHGKAGKRIIFVGQVSPQTALESWHEFDCAIHVPASENCGGVVEPLAAEIPTIASDVGGLPEVVLDGLTGWLVPVDRPEVLASTIESVLDAPLEAKRRAELGSTLVRHMFDAGRTGLEVYQIYGFLLGKSAEKPAMFDARRYVQSRLSSSGQ